MTAQKNSKIFLLQGIHQDKASKFIKTLANSNLTIDFLNPKEISQEWEQVFLDNSPTDKKASSDLEILEKVLNYFTPKSFFSGLLDFRQSGSVEDLEQSLLERHSLMEVAQELHKYHSLKIEYFKSLDVKNQKKLQKEKRDLFVQETKINLNLQRSLKVLNQSLVQELIQEQEKINQNNKDLHQKKHTTLAKSLHNQYKLLQTLDINPEKISSVLYAKLSALHGALEIQKSNPFANLFQVQENSKHKFLFVAIHPYQVSKFFKILSSFSITFQEVDWSKDIVNWENKGGLKAFQDIASGAGVKTKKEYDPTVITFIFFILFFAFCLGDALYGLLIAGFTGYFLAFKPLKKSVRSIFNLFFYSSLATLILGILTNSWGGNLLQFFPAANSFMESLAIINMGLDSASTFNPIVNNFLEGTFFESPVLFMLVLAVGIGLLHVLIGYYLKAFNALKEKGLRFFVNDLSWALFVTSIIFLIVASQEFKLYAFAVTSILWLILIITNPAKNIFKKIFGGFSALYGLVSFLADGVSYTRLIATGLSSAIIAIVINTLASDLVTSQNFVYVFFGILVLVVGHSFNLLISSFAAYINPLRLHYVEFMPKFYTGTGKLLKNKKEDLKYFKLI